MEAPRPRPSPPAGREGEPRRRGLAALAWSFVYAWRGVVDAAAGRNMRIHLAAGSAVALVASGVPLSPAADLAFLGCIALVVAAEVANTALESLVDLAARGWDERARAAKDAGAGAVLVLAAGAVAVLVAVGTHERGAFADAWRTLTAPQAVVALAVWLQLARLLTVRSRPMPRWVSPAEGAALAVALLAAALLAPRPGWIAVAAGLGAVAQQASAGRGTRRGTTLKGAD